MRWAVEPPRAPALRGHLQPPERMPPLPRAQPQPRSQQPVHWAEEPEPHLLHALAARLSGAGVDADVVAQLEASEKAVAKAEGLLGPEPLPEPQLKPEPAQDPELEAWLTQADLARYAPQIRRYGYHTLQVLLAAAEADIVEMTEHPEVRMKKPHRRLFIAKWKGLLAGPESEPEPDQGPEPTPEFELESESESDPELEEQIGLGYGLAPWPTQHDAWPVHPAEAAHAARAQNGRLVMERLIRARAKRPRRKKSSMSSTRTEQKPRDERSHDPGAGSSGDGLEVHVLDSGELSVTIHEEGRLGLGFGALPLFHH